MKATTFAVLCALAAGAWAPGAVAQAPGDAAGWYLGTGLVPFKVPPLLAGPASPGDLREAPDPSYQRFGGYRFTRTWSLDFGYAGGNRHGNGDGSIQSNAWTFSGTGLLPISRTLSLTGRLGVAVPTAEFSLSSLAASGAGADSPRNRMNVLWGFGGQYEFSPNVGLRLDYNSRYADDGGYNRARTDLWSINAIVRY